MRGRENILGFSVVAESPEACVGELAKRIASVCDSTTAKPFWLACLNPHSLRMAVSDPETEAALKDADVLIPDGVGVVLASRILGGAIRKRITGSDVFQELSRRLDFQGGASYFFLGSTCETLAVIERRLAGEFPRISFAGAYSPPFAEVFSEEQNQAMIEAINRATPDLLWVGMTAPKQEKWIHANKEKLNVKFVAAVGAVFDFYAGNVKRSHPWFLEHGLEWLPRLLQEPRRLWQRTFISAPVFFWYVFLERLKKAKTVASGSV